MIHPIPCTIGDILSQDYTFEIPRYQRAYTWHREEVGELVDDLHGSSDSLYLGTMIFDASDIKKNSSVAVVDGQQRFTTLLLMLIVCRQAALRLNENLLAAQTQGRITFVDPATGETRGSRLKTSESIRDLFDYMADQNWDGHFPVKIGKRFVRLQGRILKTAYEVIESALNIQTKAQLSKILTAIYRISIIRINVDAEEEAFSIFERTNARGVDLEVEDLLKNFLYQKGVADLNKKWDEIIKNSDGTALRMLKYFYVSRNGPVTKLELYKKLKIYSQSIASSELLVEQLLEFSIFYSLARREQSLQLLRDYLDSFGWIALSQQAERNGRMYLSLQALRLFKVTQAIPLIYAAMLCIQRLEQFESATVSQQFVRLIENIENYHFINSAVAERPSNEIERTYAMYCTEFGNSKNFTETANLLVDELKSKLISETVFSEKFTQISYSSANLGLLAYIFDRTCNFGKQPGQRTVIYDPDPSIKRRNHNIEHFFPQNPKEGESEVAESVNNIGNLLAICFRDNSSLQNDPPDRKLERLRGELANNIENLSYVGEFLTAYELLREKQKAWDDAAIKDRAETMAKDSYNRVWKFPKLAY